MKQVSRETKLIIFWVCVLCTFGAVAIGTSGDGEAEKPCDCTVIIGNQTLSVEDAFEYIAKGLSEHQYYEVMQAINNSIVK